MDSGNLVLLILGIGLLALIAYLIYKNRTVKGRFQVGPLSAELESDKLLQTLPKPAPADTVTQSSGGGGGANNNTGSTSHAGAAQIQATIQQFMTPGGGFNSKALRDFIATHFNLEEMATLAADVEVDFDSIPGQGKEAKARELVQYCERRGKLATLAAAVIDARG